MVLRPLLSRPVTGRRRPTGNRRPVMGNRQVHKGSLPTDTRRQGRRSLAMGPRLVMGKRLVMGGRPAERRLVTGSRPAERRLVMGKRLVMGRRLATGSRRADRLPVTGSRLVMGKRPERPDMAPRRAARLLRRCWAPPNRLGRC
jgi:hypothetical protein